MNKLFLILLLTGATMAASAQKFIPRGGGGHYYYAPRPRVSVGVGLGVPFGGYWGPYSYYGPYGYGWGGPFYNNWGYSGRPSKLSLEIADIQNDYNARIKEVRKDKSVPKAERKKEIRQLKTEREKEIIEAKRRYYRY